MRHQVLLVAVLLFVGFFAQAVPAEKVHGPRDWDGSMEAARKAEAQGDLTEAKTLYEHALCQAEGSETQDEHLAATLSKLASVCFRTRDLARAEECLQRGVPLSERLFGREDRRLAMPMFVLACVYEAKGRAADAEVLYTRVLAAMRASGEPADMPDLQEIYLGLGRCRIEQGRFLEADEAYRKVLVMRWNSHGHLSAAAAEIYVLQGALWLAAREYDEAGLCYRMAVHAYERSFGTDDPQLIPGLNGCASVCEAKQQWPEAVEQRKRILAILEAKHGLDAQAIAPALDGVARSYLEGRRLGDAEATWRRAVGIIEKRSGPSAAALAGPLLSLGQLAQSQGRLAEALEFHQRALGVLEAAQPTDPTALLAALTPCAALLRKLGRGEEADRIEERRKTLSTTPGAAAHELAQRWERLWALARRDAQERRYAGAAKNYQAAADAAELLGGRDSRFVQTLEEAAAVFTEPRPGVPLDRTVDYHRRLIGVLKELYGQTSPEVARACQRLGDVLAYEGAKPTDAASEYRRAASILEAEYGIEHTGLAPLHIKLASIIARGPRPADAVPLYRRGLELLEREPSVWGEDHNLRNHLYRFRDLLQRYDQEEEAARVSAKVENLCRKVREAAHQAAVSSRAASGLAAGDLFSPCYEGALAEAVPFGTTDPRFWTALDTLGRARAAVGDMAGAESCWAQMGGLAVQGASANNPDLAELYSRLGTAAMLRGKLAEAEAAFGQALAQWRAKSRAEDAAAAPLLLNLGVLKFHANKAEEAERLLRRAWRLYWDEQGAEGSATQVARARLGQALEKLGRTEEAIRLQTSPPCTRPP